MHGPPESKIALHSMFVHPLATLQAVAARPRWLSPLLLAALFSVAVNSYVVQRIGISRLLKDALRASGAIDPQSILEGALAQKTQILVFQGLGTLVGTFATALVVAKVLYLILAMAGTDIPYRKILAIVSHVSMLIVVIRESMMVLTTILMQDLAGFNPQNPLATNPAFFLRPAPTAFYHLLRSMDLITFAQIALLALGLIQLSPRVRVRNAFAYVVIPWAVYVAGSILLPFPG